MNDAIVTFNASRTTRAEKVIAHLRQRIDKAREMGGDVQFILDIKLTNGNPVNVCFDMKERLDLS